MAEKNIDFQVDYSQLKIFDEYNTKDFAYPLVLSSPHSGRIFPSEFLANVALSEKQLRISEDCYVDELVKYASDQGIPLLTMNLHRTFIDVNRDKIEIDDSMYFNHPSPQTGLGSRRCRVGLGVIHRAVYPNQNIYTGLISYDEVQERIKNVYDVYHKKLKQLVDRCVKKFGMCLLIDCHSMPGRICSIMNESKPIDFSMGTLFDESCPSEISAELSRILSQKDYRVEMNRPYAGGFITFNFCQPRKNIYTLQLEMNRSMYMNENVYKKTDGFQTLSETLGDSFSQLGKFLLDFKK